MKLLKEHVVEGGYYIHTDNKEDYDLLCDIIKDLIEEDTTNI